MEIRSIIFDVDDTLYDYTSAAKTAMDAISEYCLNNFGWDSAYTKKRTLETMYRQFNTLGMNDSAIHNRLIRFQMLLEEEKKPVYPHALTMYTLYWDTLCKNMNIADGVTDFIKAAKSKGISIGICTDMTSLIQYIKLDKLGILSLLDHIVTSEEAGVEKPDAGIFDLCIKKSGCLPHECLMIGDNWDKDILGALDSGMNACWFHPENAGKDTLRINFSDPAEPFESKLKTPYIRRYFEEGRLIVTDNYFKLRDILK